MAIDDNLPTFQFRASSDDPDSSVLYFSQNGSEPTPEYVLKRADPASQPSCRGNYAVGLVDPFGPGVVYGEVMVSPEWQQPTLSAAEIRAQNAVAAPPVPIVPDTFSVQLYDPDQTVSFKMMPGSWGKSDAWEFEMPTRSFRLPSASQLDRQQDPTPVRDLAPKVMFKWKRDSRLSKDMTCYLVGRSLGRHKSKEPDITVALFKQGRDSLVTIYEPNLQRVEVEDRKGLDIVLLLGAEVIRDLYLSPRSDVFNMMGSDPARLRKNSRPSPSPHHNAPASQSAVVMSGALGAPPAARVDAETRRLQEMVEREERERKAEAERAQKERERQDAEEQKRIKEMLEQEEARERQRRDAEIAMETERLRKMYGTEGQDLPSARPGLPPHAQGPSRPFSAGPNGQPAAAATPNNSSSWWSGGSSAAGTGAPGPSHKPQQQPARPTGPDSSGGHGRNPSASISGFFSRDRDENGKKVRKKRSVQF
ncbi:hypothetical protein RB595_001265 [Gaeumannomyces hyphopodioides]